MDAELNENSNNGVKNSVLTRALSHIGLIIQSTTLDTEEKVIAIYGGEHWIRHSGYFLRGATTDVIPNQAQSDGGSDEHTHTVNSHSHTINHYHSIGTNRTAVWGNSRNGLQYCEGGPVANDWQFTTSDASTGSSGAAAPGTNSVSNIPSYKNVYIWERVS